MRTCSFVQVQAPRLVERRRWHLRWAGLRNRFVVVQHWHLVDLGSGFTQRLALLDGAAHDATRSFYFFLFFRLLARKLCDAEDELQAAQLDVAAVMEKCRALPACTAAPYETGAAGLATALSEVRVLSLAAHHSAHITTRLILLFFLLSLFTATWTAGGVN